MFLNKSNLDSTRYNSQLLLSYKRKLSMVVGERRVGKTFHFVWKLVEKSLKKHAITFMWLRIMKTEIDEAKASFFEDIEKFNIFPEYSFKVVGNYGYATLLATGRLLQYVTLALLRTLKQLKALLSLMLKSSY